MRNIYYLVTTINSWRNCILPSVNIHYSYVLHFHSVADHLGLCPDRLYTSSYFTHSKIPIWSISFFVYVKMIPNSKYSWRELTIPNLAKPKPVLWW